MSSNKSGKIFFEILIIPYLNDWVIALLVGILKIIQNGENRFHASPKMKRI